RRPALAAVAAGAGPSPAPHRRDPRPDGRRRPARTAPGAPARRGGTAGARLAAAACRMGFPPELRRGGAGPGGVLPALAGRPGRCPRRGRACRLVEAAEQAPAGRAQTAPGGAHQSGAAGDTGGEAGAAPQPRRAAELNLECPPVSLSKGVLEMSSRNSPSGSPLSWLGLGKQASRPSATAIIRQENLGRGNVGK